MHFQHLAGIWFSSQRLPCDHQASLSLTWTFSCQVWKFEINRQDNDPCRIELWWAFLNSMVSFFQSFRHLSCNNFFISSPSMGGLGKKTWCSGKCRAFRANGCGLSRRSATFTPPANVRRQPLPVWPPTLNKIPLPFYIQTMTVKMLLIGEMFRPLWGFINFRKKGFFWERWSPERGNILKPWKCGHFWLVHSSADHSQLWLLNELL